MMLQQTTPEVFFDVLGYEPPEWFRDEAYEFFRRLISEPDSPELAELGGEVWIKADARLRIDLVRASYLVWPHAGPLVRGELLRSTWTHGKHGSPLTVNGYSPLRILRWLTKEPRPMLMTPAEELVFQSLPSRVSAFRGSFRRIKQAAVKGLSWTLDEEVAEYFAMRASLAEEHGPGVIIRAEFPREAGRLF